MFLLVRHAAHDNVGGFLAGRRAGVTLGVAGRAQAERLARHLAPERPAAIWSSPRERCRETAGAIAAAAGLGAPMVDDRLDEIDFGAWSGRTFDDLDADGEWRRWNTVRSIARTPAGDTMPAVQARVLALIEELRGREAAGPLVLVTHADVIKAAVCFFLGLSLDAWPRFDIDPASVTRLVLEPWQARLLRINEFGG